MGKGLKDHYTSGREMALENSNLNDLCIKIKLKNHEISIHTRKKKKSLLL